MSFRLFAIAILIATSQSKADDVLKSDERKRVVDSLAASVQAKIKEIDAAIERVKSGRINASLRAAHLPANPNAVWQFPSKQSQESHLEVAEKAKSQIKDNFMSMIKPIHHPFNTGDFGRIAKAEVYTIEEDGSMTIWIPDAKGEYISRGQAIAVIYGLDTKRFVTGKEYQIDGIWVASDAVVDYRGKSYNSLKRFVPTAKEVELILGR